MSRVDSVPLMRTAERLVRVTRFYTTPEGGSAFDDVDIPVSLVSPDAWGNELRMSESFVSPAVRVFEAPVGAFQDWHNAPRRQLCIMMQGIWEIGTTDGQNAAGDRANPSCRTMSRARATPAR